MTDNYFLIQKNNEFIRQLEECLYNLSILIYRLDEKINELKNAYDNISIKINQIDLSRELAKAFK